MKKNKTGGFSLFEISIYISLLFIFIYSVFPLINMNTKLNTQLMIRSNMSRNHEMLVEIIEESIAHSGGIYYFKGKEHLKTPVEVFNHPGLTIENLPAEFFSAESRVENTLFPEFESTANVRTGNLLFMEITGTNGKRFEKGLLIFHFINNSLMVYEGGIIRNTASFDLKKRKTLREHTKGEFARTETGIFITMTVTDVHSEERRTFNGYETIPRQY